MYKTIKFKKKVELKAGEDYGIVFNEKGDKVIIKKITAFDEFGDPIFGETIYEDK